MIKIVKTNIEKNTRVELHNQLRLTGAEVSINTLPAGTNVPFIHSHKQNEEIYGILSGSGKIILDDKEFLLKAGDWFKVTPTNKRQIFASENEAIRYVCIQVKEHSLEKFTMTDAIVD